jgi:N-acetylneuraminic acid mutarotase
MKKYITAIIVLLFSFLYVNMVYATANTWTQKADFGGASTSGLDFASGFSIGVKGYIGLGYNGSDVTEFWKYDPTANTWTQVASFTGSARSGAVGFSIGTKGYVGLGASGTLITTYYNDFYEYDSIANKWTAKTSFPGTKRGGAVGFSIGSKGYVGTGATSSSAFTTDFYEYDPTGNSGAGSWTSKTAFPGTARGGAVGFSIGTKGYVGLGGTSTSSSGLKTDFYQYDPSTNAWTSMTAFTGSARTNAVGFAIGSKGYVGTGGFPNTTASSVTYTNDFYEYDPSANSWTAKLSFPATARYGAVGFSVGSRGYIGTGYTGTNGSFGTKVKDFYEYEPATMPDPLYAAFTGQGIWKWDGNRWTKNTGSTPQSMVTLGTNLYCAFTGQGIWKWDGSTWAQITSNISQLIAATTTTLYGVFANFGVWQWNGSTWTQIVQNNSTPYLMTASSSKLYAVVLADLNIYKGIWVWDGSTWTRLTPYTPQLMTASSSTLYGAFSGQGIWKYDGSTWTQATSYTPQLMTASSSTLYGAFSGQGIWKYDGNTWTQATIFTPVAMTASSSNLYATFTDYGISQWDGSNWFQITSSVPVSMAVGN